MPVQFAPMITAILLFSGAVLEGAAAVTVIQIPIVTNSTLRAWCIIGAVIGAVIAVATFPPDSPNTASGMQRVLWKFTGSSLLGFMCGPMASRYLGIQVNEDMVMFVAGSISLLGVAVLHATAPLIPSTVRTFVNILLAAAKAALGAKDKP